ncbi:MAG: hypothetical protein MUF14_00380 [Hyphomonadaceae bacterium]|jgi:hypothetical protein|nr:hypothetical protein [Hyphomonadaceae bacterium]
MPHEVALLGPDGILVPVDMRDFGPQCDRLHARAVAPFADGSIRLLGVISRLLLTAPDARGIPQFTALGYWLRPSMLQRMKHAFDDTLRPGQVATPRGTAFHLPPQNVDTLFVYSWALSVLAGNSNIVRLPSQISRTTQILCTTIAAALAETGENERHLFCTYDHGSGLNRTISALSDLRMVWGGDEKVRTVGTDPLQPDGLSLGFPDRQSFSIIAAAIYADLPVAGRDQLANQLYNDIYWFDQMGCGSPRVIFWLGEIGDLADDLFTRLVNVARSKSYKTEASVSVSKYVRMNDMVASGVAQTGTRFGPELDVVNTSLSPALAAHHHGGGFLISTPLGSLEDILPTINRQVQTITHFGLQPPQLEQFAKSLIGKGGYRIVPIGEALSFEPIWDGVDLLAHMTRRIVWR